MSKIDDDLPAGVLTALAEACGFRITFDPSPDVDEWTLSGTLPAGLTTFDVQHVGTRRSACAFLIGYSTMRLQTAQILNELESGNRKLFLDMRERLRALIE